VVSMWCRMMRNMYFGCSGSSTQRCFPDLIADYFQSVAPAGLPNDGRVSTLLVNKLLPTVLGPLQPVTVLVLPELLPVPTAAFITTLLLNQSLWMKDDLVQRRPELLCIHYFSILVLSVAAIAFTRVRSDRSAGIVLSSFCIHCSYYLNSTAGTGLPRLSQN